MSINHSFWEDGNSPDFTASPICSSDIVTDFPFSRKILADPGKQLQQPMPKLLSAASITS